MVARQDKVLDEYGDRLRQKGLDSLKISRKEGGRRAFEGVRLATMHRVKGLEFQYVFVVAANKGVIPLAAALDGADQLAVAEAEAAERCLLYVALTRAQKQAYVTSYGPATEFLP